MTASPAVRVVKSADVADGERDEIKRLFASTYDQANLDYLDRSLVKLGYLSLAERDRRVIGFAVGDAVRTRLAGCSEPQAVGLAGISCIDPAYRRKGLFSELSIAATFASGAIGEAGRFLFAGRMAHPVTYRTMANRSDNTVPRARVELTEWHKSIGQQVADLYGVTFDRNTFVVVGDGVPIGFPKVQYETTAEEEQLFRQVDRNRGDSLLALCWMPTAPSGW